MRKIKSVREQVYDHVIHLIRTKELDYGDKIDILKLQESLGVSRPPINEALIQLSADGFLDNIPRKGFFVRAMSDKELHNTYEIIATLDVYALEKVMENVTEKNTDMLRIIVSKIDEAIAKRNYDEYYELQEEFHKAYLEFCGNPVLRELICELMKKVIRTTAFSEDTEALFVYFQKANDDHAKIVDCIEKKNLKELKRIARTHWQAPVEIELDNKNEKKD